MNQTVTPTKEQLIDQYFSQLDKFETRLQSAGIEMSDYYELIDLFRSYTSMDAEEQRLKRDPNVRIVILDDSLNRTVLEGVMISTSSALAITDNGRHEMMRRLQAGTLSEVM